MTKSGYKSGNSKETQKVKLHLENVCLFHLLSEPWEWNKQVKRPTEQN